MSRAQDHERELVRAIGKATKGADPVAVQALAASILKGAAMVASAPAPHHITTGAFRAEVTELADACADLERRLAASKVLSALPVVAAIVNGSAVDEDGHARLRDLLARLRTDLRAALAATDGNPTTPQLDLPTRGDRPDDTRRIASYVLGMLFRHGGRVSAAAETSPAVECVRAVFGALSLEAGARHHVAEWIKRHPEAPD